MKKLEIFYVLKMPSEAESPDPSAESDGAESSSPPSALREIPEGSDLQCKLCFETSQPTTLGPLYEYTVDPETEVYRAHYFCLLFSSGLDQNGGEDEDIKGFLTADILKEWRRGARLKCCHCEQKYATVRRGEKQDF